MEGSGMVAIVRGLRDAGLAVTLLDNGKQYTLVPDSETRRSEQNGAGVQRSAATNCTDGGFSCDSAAQATDGRYASVYKTTHCKVQPSSPPTILTEFPPQRVSVCRGSDNFVVGGAGSGDTNYNPVRANGSFRGGMCWTDRASVFSPRPSRQPDAFADSLRKYPPAVTLDRSSEVVERLINYTQAKNFKNQRFQRASPTRSNLENLDNYELNARMASKPRTYDPEINIGQRIDESPTRGPKRHYNVNYDVRYMRDMSKKVRDNIKNMCSCPYHQPNNNFFRERYEMPMHEKRRLDVNIPCTVSTESQASAKMVCREVATTPRIEPSKRNVAVPISPASSDITENSEGQVSTPQAIKSVQTNYVPGYPKKMRKSVQTTLSSIELVNKYRCRSLRSSKSKDEIGINNEDFRVEVLRWLDEVFCSQERKISKNYMFDKLNAKLNKLSKFRGRSKTKIGIIKSKTDSSKICVKGSFKSITDDFKNKTYFPNKFSTEVYRTEVIPFKALEAKERKDVIKDWMNKIPLKSHDFLERPVEKKRILNSVVYKLKEISSKTPELLKNKLTGEIIDMLNEMPINIEDSNNKRSYFNTIAISLVDDLCNNNRKYNSTSKNVSNIPNRVQLKSDVQPTQEELKAFINKELEDIIEKTCIQISEQGLEQIESDILEIVIDGMSAISSEYDKNIREEIVALMQQSAGLFEHQATYITNVLLDHISAASSDITENSEGHISTPQAIKSVQTNYLSGYPKKMRKSVQTTLSSIELVDKYRCRSLRRSKSEDEIGVNNEDFRVEVLRWLDEVFCSQERKISKNYMFDKLNAKLNKLSKFRGRSKTKIGMIKSKTDSSKICVKGSFKSISDDFKNKTNFPNRFSTEVYRAQVIPFKALEAKERKDVIKDWMNKIPLKSHDFLERPVEKKRILNSVFYKLKDISSTTPEFLKNKLKGAIIDMLNEMPIDIKGSNNKRSYLNTIASFLVDDLCSNNRKYNSGYKNVYGNIPNRVQFKSDVQPTEEELKAFINIELEDIIEKTCIQISEQGLEQIESDILEIVIDGMSAISSEYDKNIREEIVALLQQSAGLFEHQATYITNVLLDHISAASSDITENSEGHISTPQAIKSVQTNYLSGYPKKMRKSVQTTLSSIELVDKYRCRSLRRSKSEDEIGVNNEDFRVEVLRWLDEVFCSQERKISKNYMFDKLNAKLNKLSKFRGRSKTKIGIIKSKTDSSKICVKGSFKSITDDFKNKTNFPNRFSTEVYRAQVIPFKALEAKERKDVIKDWMNKIPLKSHDFLERPVEKKRILNSVFYKLKDISSTTPEFLKNKLKGEIIDMLNEMPIDIKGSNNKRSYLNTIASFLVDDLCSNNRKYNSGYKNVYSNIPNRVQFKSDVQPTEEELKAFINIELEDIIEKTCIQISEQRLEQIESDIMDIVIDGMSAISSEHDKNIREEIVALLQQSAGLFEHQAVYITNLFLDHMREMLNYIEQSQVGSIPCRLETVMMLQNSTMSSLNNSSIAGITEEDIETNLNRYIEQLSQQIDEWLTSLRILRTHEQSFRQVVVSDLAADIVDRLKYLELNPSTKTSDQEELEHLKFQIFKWINKLVGENHTETIEQAPDLMQRIRSVPVPMLTRPGAGFNMSNYPGNVSQMPMFGPQGPGGSMTENRKKNRFQGRFSGPGGYASGPMYDMSDSINMSQMPIFGPAGPGGSMMEQQQPAAGWNRSSPGALGIQASPGPRSQSVHPPKTMQELNEEFDDFVQKWVEEIPIAVTSPEEQELLPTMRAGLYNGVWRAITKLKCQPDVLTNPFYFEDKLDDEIEALFAMIPLTPELESNKHKLKVKLIEKTSHINDLIKNAAQSESFKQRIIDNLDIYIPRLETDEANEDPIRLHEELEILYLVEEYILFTRFKDDDPVKASVYRNKLLKRVQELVQEIKRSHGKEMKDINPETYANDIVTALHQVPLPNNETIKQEADQILLGLEIERWYADLPIARNNDLGEQLKRRRLRDALGRKIYEMERSMDFSDSDAERALKHEVSRFLERVPLGRDETLNINFMVDELTNRMKNRPRPPGEGKKVLFDETVDYQNFNDNIPSRTACSSRIEEAVAEVARNLSAQLHQSVTATSVLDGSLPQAHFSRQGGQSYAPNVSIIQGSGPYPQNTVMQSPEGYSGFDQRRPISSSLNATAGAIQFQPGPYNSLIQSPGRYSVYDQDISLHGTGQPQAVVVSPGQASMRSFTPGPTDQSGQWMSLIQSSVGPQNLGLQNSSAVGQSIPQAAVQQSFSQPHNHSSVHAGSQNPMAQNPIGYMSFDEENPISSSFIQQASGGVEYFSMTGSSGQPIHGAGQVSIVPLIQNVSVHTPRASMQSQMQPSPVNMSEQQWQSLLSGSLPADQSMARQNMSIQAPPIRQASSVQQSFRNGTVPSSSFFSPPNSVVQSPIGFQTFEQERPISSSHNQQDPGRLYYTMPSFRNQVSMATGINSLSSLTNETPQMQSQVMSPRQQTMQGNLSGRSVLASSLRQGVTPQEIFQASPANVTVPNVSMQRSMGQSIHTQGVGTQSGIRMASPDQGLFLAQEPSGTLSSYGQPYVGFSTPQQGVPPIPPGLRRKQMREGQNTQRDPVRRRLELEEDIDEVRGGPCRCIDKLKRYRKTRYPCPSYDMEFRVTPRGCYNPYYF